MKRRIRSERAWMGRQFQTLLRKLFFIHLHVLRASRKVNFAMKDMQKCLEGKDKSQEQIAFSWIGIQNSSFQRELKARDALPHRGKKQTCIQTQLWGNIWLPQWQNEKAHFHAIMKYIILQWHTNRLFLFVFTQDTFSATTQLSKMLTLEI